MNFYDLKSIEESSVNELLKTIVFKDIKNFHNNQMPCPQYDKTQLLAKKLKAEKLKMKA